MLNNLIIANWKMNKTPKETVEFFEILNKEVQEETVVCVPFTNLHAALESVKNKKIKVGAQNCFWEDFGPYTGEISAKMLSVIGVTYVIVGHSERRTLFCENDEMINKKIKAAIKHNLKTILCVGENKTEREKDIQNEIVINQVKAGLSGVENIHNIIIAYEPIWAIGTGNTCSSKEAERICFEIRNFIKTEYGEKIANNLYILYGGSVNAENAKEFLEKENINGGLVGGASLDVKNFSQLIKSS